MRRIWDRVMFVVGLPFALILIAILEGSAFLHRRRIRRGRS